MSEIIEEQALKALHSVLDARIPKVRLLNLVQGELKAKIPVKWCFRTLFIMLRVDDVSGQDADGSGALDFNEFVSLVEHLKKVSHAMTQKKPHAKHKHEHNAHSEDPEIDALFHTIDMDDRHARTSSGLVIHLLCVLSVVLFRLESFGTTV